MKGVQVIGRSNLFWIDMIMQLIWVMRKGVLGKSGLTNTHISSYLLNLIAAQMVNLTFKIQHLKFLMIEIATPNKSARECA
jgi:hypothetical protein